MSSGGIQYEIIMDAAASEKVMLETASYFPRYINSWLVQSAIKAKEEMASRVNEGVGAAYGQGIKNNIGVDYDPVAMTALVKPNSNVPYADGLETGTRPHRPPAGPDSSLAQWCEMKGLNVWAVAKSIERNGTKPHPFIGPAYDAVKRPIAALFTEGVNTYLLRMGARI
jgi:hypothetical protein